MFWLRNKNINFQLCTLIVICHCPLNFIRVITLRTFSSNDFALSGKLLQQFMFKQTEYLWIARDHTVQGAQWLSGRVLDSKQRGCRFQPYQRHCVVVL